MRGETAQGTTDRLRVLIVTYACSPYRGSEPGAGWHRARECAKHCDTWVVCEEREFKPDIERYLQEHGPIPNLRFHFVPTVGSARAVLRLLRPLWYVVYNLWQRRALRAARRLHRDVGFDVVHQAGLCGFREPGYLWKMDVPFVWGPVGGTQSYPARFLVQAGVGGLLKEGGRAIVSSLQFRYNRRVRSAVKNATIILAANSTGQRHFESIHGVHAERLLETGVNQVAPRPRRRQRAGPFRLLWSGQFEHHKALPLLFRALAQLSPNPSYELKILGRGSLERPWRRMAKRLAVDSRCEWLGWLSHAEAIEQCIAAEVLVFTSLRDTSGNAVLEALSYGVPVICLDHQGVGDIVTERCGIKIPVTEPKEVVRGISRAIDHLSRSPDVLDALSEGAIERAREYLWSRTGERMARIYERAAATRRGLHSPAEPDRP